MKRPGIVNLFFDLDGTLTDSREGIVRCLRYALERMGVEPPPPSALERYIGPSLYRSFAELLDTAHAAAIGEAVAHYRERFAATGIYENSVYDGIEGVLDRLARDGHSLWVVTTKPTVYARRIAEHFSLAAYFRDVVGANLDGSRSEKAELIAHVLSAHDLRAGDTAMIGDRRDDIVGARTTGVAAIGALWGFGSREELVAAGAGSLCGRPPELPGAVAAAGAP